MRIMPDVKIVEDLKLKVEIIDFTEKLIRISISNDNFTVMSFSAFEKMTKCCYAAYKKYKYIFEKGK